jgi:hypothetical protein
MELVAYFMMALIAFGACLDLPVAINYEDFDKPVDTNDGGSWRSAPSTPNPPALHRDPVGGGAGPDSTKT